MGGEGNNNIFCRAGENDFKKKRSSLYFIDGTSELTVMKRVIDNGKSYAVIMPWAQDITTLLLGFYMCALAADNIVIC